MKHRFFQSEILLIPDSCLLESVKIRVHLWLRLFLEIDNHTFDRGQSFERFFL